MKSDQKRVSALLVQTVSLLCKNGLHFEKNIHIQGLLAITVDEKDVFIVQLDDSLWPKQIDKVPTTNETAPSACGTSTNNNDPQLDQRQLDRTPEQHMDNQANKNEVLVNHHSNNITPNHAEDDLKRIEDHAKDTDEIIFIKTEISTIEEKKEHETSSIISSNDSNQNVFNNELIPINQNHQPFSNSYHMNSMNNASHKPVNERGRKRRIQRMVDDDFNMAPIENLENSLVPSYDNFHAYKNDLAADLVKESWTYTKYHASKHSPKAIQSNYTSPSNNYHDKDSLMLFKNNRNDNQFNISNNSNEQHFQSNNSNLPRRRSNMKTVVCQYPDCGKTFCHSCHLYRHQRLKHGHRYGVVAQASFKCQHHKCGKVFYRRSSLINHCLHVHSSTTEPFNPPPSQFPFPPPSPGNHPNADSILLDDAGNVDDEGQYHDAGDDDMTMNHHDDQRNVAECSYSYVG